MASLTGIHIISLVGYQGSGKSTIGRKTAQELCTEHIEVSDVVREMHANLSRSELASTGVYTQKNPDWLGSAVSDKIYGVHKEFKVDIVVLTGVREMVVHKFLQKRGGHIWAFEVRADAPVRYQRLLKLGKLHTAEEFLDQEVREKKLGTDEVTLNAPFAIPTSVVTEPEQIANKIIAKLNNQGVRL